MKNNQYFPRITIEKGTRIPGREGIKSFVSDCIDGTMCPSLNLYRSRVHLFGKDASKK
jgi:hypothetical protein